MPALLGRLRKGRDANRNAAPRRLGARIAITVAIVLAVGMLPTCMTMAAFPVGTRLAAPLVCPADTARTEVTSRWGGGSKGGRSLKWDLYCLSEQGHGTIPSTPKIFFGVLAVWSAVVGVLFVGLGLRNRRRRSTEAAPAGSGGGSDAA